MRALEEALENFAGCAVVSVTIAGFWIALLHNLALKAIKSRVLRRQLQRI